MAGSGLHVVLSGSSGLIGVDNVKVGVDCM